MSLRALIEAAIAATPDEETHDIAARLIEQVEPEDMVELLAREVDRVRRDHARRVERDGMAAFRAAFAAAQAPPLPEASPDLRALFHSAFHLGDGTIVAWGSATIAQHELRIAFLERQRDGLDQSIELHREAIRLIAAAAAACLDGVYAAEEVAA